MKTLNQLNFKKLNKQELNPLKGGVSADAVTNSHGQITKSAGNFDADNKTSDSDTASSIKLLEN
jgi:natural product precursor